MNTERFIGDEVLVKLTIKEITEDENGIRYSLVGKNDVLSIYVKEEELIDE